MNKEYKAIEMLQDLSAYATLSGPQLSRVVSHDLTAVAELLHTGETDILPKSLGAKAKLDAKFEGQINQWN